MLRRLILPLLLVAGLLSLTAGCTGYRLGTGGSLAFSSLHVAPVQMRALLPQGQPILTSAIREAFARDGRMQLDASPKTAGAVLNVVVQDYRREVATVRPGDTGLARKFTVTLTAVATLHSTRDGQAYFRDRTIEVKRDVFTDSGQQQAEYQILPLLAQDLATKLTHSVLDTW